MLLSIEQLNTIMGRLSPSNYHLEIIADKRRIAVFDMEGTRLAFFRWPVHYHLTTGEFVENQAVVCVLLIKAGSAALGILHDSMLLEHKVFKTYMVRKKQGKNQLKYLNSKGKSRAGSRIRLANANHFFEQINERLTLYTEDYDIDVLALSCSKTLLPFLYHSKATFPFAKNTQEFYKIPKHLERADYESMKSICDYLSNGEFIPENENFERIVNSWL